MGKAKLENKIRLYDFLVLSNSTYDTCDIEYDGIITCDGIEDEPQDNYEKFYQEMCKKVEILNNDGCHLLINWIDLIKRNIDKFKQFSKENWKYDYEEDGDDELIYQWINEIHLYFAGYVGDDTYKKLISFVESLD